MDSRFLLSHIRHYPLLQERSLHFARDDVTEVAFSQHIRCTLREINPSPPPSFRAQREIFLALCSFLFLSRKDSPSLLSHIRRYTSVPERSLDFARDDVAEVAFSQHILYTGRGLSIPHTVSLAASPQSPTTKKPQPKLELFCVRKTYLPNCASMVPAATAVPITPATFGPIACISR